MDSLPLTSDSDCPGPAAIQAEVRELTTPAQRAAVPADARVAVLDRGETITIALTRDGKTTVRVYRDAARDCARRAHFVSVLAVVALMPPELGSEEEAPVPPPTPESESTPTATAPPSPPAPSGTKRRAPIVRAELGARADVSVPISDTIRVALPSAALGVALGAGHLRFTLGTAVAKATEARFTGNAAGNVRLSRLEVAVGARYVLAHEPLDASVDVSLLATREEVTGGSARQPSADSAFSAGGRVGVHACWSERAWVSPFLGAYASVFPFAPAISELPPGTVGHLPYFWVGLSGGLTLAL